jgi:hypothetical protein
VKAFFSDREGPLSPARILAAVAFLAAAYWVGSLFTAARALNDWLLPRYLAAWGGAALFGLSSYAVGLRIVGALWNPSDLRPGRRVLAIAAGVLVFVWGTFLVGICGGLGTFFFLAWPAVLLLIGLEPLAREGAAVWSALVDRRWQLSWMDALALVLGAIAFFAMYLPMLSVDNLNYDARWYQLAYAEHYTAAGGIVRLPEGPLQGAAPQLAILLYTWAWQLPNSAMFDRIELCLHVELLLTCVTIVSIPTLVQLLRPGVRATPIAALAFFLFPQIFMYDTGIQGAADHVAAFWSIPIWVALILFWKKLGWREATLVAIPIAGLALTKNSAVATLVPILLALLIRAGWRARSGVGVAVAELGRLLVLGLAFTTVHWLKNVIFYGDPVYPVLGNLFPTHPWTVDSAHRLQVFVDDNFKPVASFSINLRNAFKALWEYHYAPGYNYGDFHGGHPAFGSLFAASVLVLPFLRGTKRIWGLALLIHVGLLAWFYMAHNERFLQPAIPWMAAVTAATLGLAWASGSWLLRVGVVALIGAQVAGQADIPFFPTHRMNGRSTPFASTVELLGAGYRGDAAARTHVFKEWEQIGALLPIDAKVLVHDWPLRFGIRRQTVTDIMFGVQYGISYGHLGSLEALHEKFKEMGVTHVAWYSGVIDTNDSISGELLFRAYTHATTFQRTAAGWNVGTLPETPPKDVGHSVLVIGCGSPFKTGLYELSDLNASALPQAVTLPQFNPREETADLPSLAAKADWIAIETACNKPLDLGAFLPLGRRTAAPAMDLYVRKAPHVDPPPKPPEPAPQVDAGSP